MRDGLALSLASTDLVSSAAFDTWLRDETRIEAGRAAEVSLRLAEFRDVQSCLLNLFDAAIDGRPLPVDSVEQINGTSARVPRVAVLGDDGSSLEPLAASGATRLLAEIAWSAIDLLGGPERERLRRCGACGTIFVATRPDRLWCSDRCGNRIRVARHHARSKNPSYPVRR